MIEQIKYYDKCTVLFLIRNLLYTKQGKQTKTRELGKKKKEEKEKKTIHVQMVIKDFGMNLSDVRQLCLSL